MFSTVTVSCQCLSLTWPFLSIKDFSKFKEVHNAAGDTEPLICSPILDNIELALPGTIISEED